MTQRPPPAPAGARRPRARRSRASAARSGARGARSEARAARSEARVQAAATRAMWCGGDERCAVRGRRGGSGGSRASGPRWGDAVRNRAAPGTARTRRGGAARPGRCGAESYRPESGVLLYGAVRDGPDVRTLRVRARDGAGLAGAVPGMVRARDAADLAGAGPGCAGPRACSRVCVLLCVPCARPARCPHRMRVQVCVPVVLAGRAAGCRSRGRDVTAPPSAGGWCFGHPHGGGLWSGP